MKVQKISILALPVMLAGCSASKYVQEGEYILNKVEVKSDSAAYDAGALKQYVRQKEKPKLFSLFHNPFSKKPVVYDTLQAQLSCRDLLTAMQNQGFLHAGVTLQTEIHGQEKTDSIAENGSENETGTDGKENQATNKPANKSRKKAPKVDVTYMLHPGEPFHIGKVEYDIEDKNIEQILKLDEPENQKIKPGMRFTVDALDAERKRIANRLLDDGYFRFNKDFIQFSADTIAGQKDIAVTLNLLKYKANSNAPETDHPRYEIRNISYQSNDSDRIHLRHRVMMIDVSHKLHHHLGLLTGRGKQVISKTQIVEIPWTSFITQLAQTIMQQSQNKTYILFHFTIRTLAVSQFCHIAKGFPLLIPSFFHLSAYCLIIRFALDAVYPPHQDLKNFLGAQLQSIIRPNILSANALYHQIQGISSIALSDFIS